VFLKDPSLESLYLTAELPTLVLNEAVTSVVVKNVVTGFTFTYTRALLNGFLN